MRRAKVINCKYLVRDNFPVHGCKHPTATSGCICKEYLDECKRAERRYRVKERKGVQFIIYTAPECPKCIDQKKKWDAEGIGYQERSADRIKDHQDEYDREAHVESAMQNEQLPVIIKREDIK